MILAKLCSCLLRYGVCERNRDNNYYLYFLADIGYSHDNVVCL